MEPRVFETDTTSDNMVRRFVVQADKRAGAYEVVSAEGIPKLNDRHGKVDQFGRYIVAGIVATPRVPQPESDFVEWDVTVAYEVPRQRKVCVVLVDRANLGRLSPVLRAIADHPDLELQIVCAGSMLLPRFGSPVDIVRKEYVVSGEVWCEIEGSTLGTMADGIGYAIPLFGAQYEKLKPDIVLAIGDRYEMLAAVISAAYRNIPIVHLQGGETSGSIDESARHCITKLSHFHVPATEQAAENILRMGEHPDSLLCIGCPSADLAAEVSIDDDEEDRPTGPILCVYHPTTTEGDNGLQMVEVLKSLAGVPHKVDLLWPNIDAHSDEISKAIRVWKDQYKAKGLSLDWLTTIKNLPPAEYLHRLANTRCAVGNSSSFVRDSSFFGTPVVLVGHRQDGRECGPNVLRVKCGKEFIVSAIEQQLSHGRYPASNLYGEPGISEVIADKLATVELYSQKRLYYPVEVAT